MEIEEFKDGYCITHKGIDYKYSGKSESVIIMISSKVKELMNKDLEALRKKILTDNYLT